MTDHTKTNTETSFDIASCLAMMEKMLGGNGAGCDCAAMMSQPIGREDMPEEWRQAMSQMMETCCRPRDEEEETR